MFNKRKSHFFSKSPIDSSPPFSAKFTRGTTFRKAQLTNIENENFIILPDYIEDEAKITKIEYYKQDRRKIIVYHILSILTLGILVLLCRWRHGLRLLMRYVSSDSISADYLVIHGHDETIEHVHIFIKTFYFGSAREQCKSFTYRLYVYFLDQEDGYFKPCQFSLNNKTYNAIHAELGLGMSSKALYEQRLLTFGTNSTDVVIKSDFGIILDELLSPFYLFQLFAIIFWGFFNNYPIYASFLFVFSMFTLFLSFLKIRSNYEALRQKASFQTDINVFRPIHEEGQKIIQAPKTVNSIVLVPGDLIEIPSGTKMPCDIILLSGSCIMNESMFTGESFPVIKSALPRSDKIFDLITADQHILYSGTECLETRSTGAEPQIIGVVLRTGFSTAKGRLIRSFLYTKPENFQFYKDSLKYIFAMSLFAVICFIVSVIFFVDNHKSTKDIIIRSLDIITISVPPVLPTVLSIGSLLASFRLSRNNIITKSELKINVAGKVDIACFDKTGTLTKASLGLYGVKIVSQTEEKEAKFQHLIRDHMQDNIPDSEKKTQNHFMFELMATCHCITFIGEILSGDPLDVKMCESSGWRLDERDKSTPKLFMMRAPINSSLEKVFYDEYQLDVIQRFNFNPELQRMSVIVRDNRERSLRMYVKGSPEAIKEICKPETVPADFEKILEKYTQNGFRVIGCATKRIKTQIRASDNLAREYFEKKLVFLGFLVFENKLKDVSHSVIQKLLNAGIPTVMLTGDNPSTAAFVAKQCGFLHAADRIIVGSMSPPSLTVKSKQIQWTWLDGIPFLDTVENAKFPFAVNSPLNSPADHIEFEMSGTPIALCDIIFDEPAALDVIKSIKHDSRVKIVMTGEVFRKLRAEASDDPQFYENILNKTKAFARMRPDDKYLVIEEFQKQKKIVAMCGDGAHDCPALKMANIGIALGEAEASLAASFMSKVFNISCIEILMREGRAALVTSFQCFKYMSLYSLIQAFSTVIAYSNSTTIRDYCFLYQDLFIVIPTVITMSFSPPTDKLSKEQPPGTLLSVPVLLSVIGQAVLQCITQVISVAILHSREWYLKPVDLRIEEEADDDIPDYDNTLLSLVANVQYTAVVLAFSIGRPFREPFYKNKSFLVVWIITLVASLILILIPMPPIINFLQMRDFKGHQIFRWIIFIIVIINGILTMVYEKYAAPFLSAKLLQQIEKIKKKPL